MFYHKTTKTNVAELNELAKQIHKHGVILMGAGFKGIFFAIGP